MLREVPQPKPSAGAPGPTLGAASAAKASSSVSRGCKDGGLIPTPGNLARVVAATLCLINRQRAAHGLASVHTNAAMRKAATQHSQDMVTHNFFGHTGSSGADLLARLKSAGYIKPDRGFAIAENIAAAGGADATPNAIVAMWMNSPEHRANILSPAYRDTGIGVVAALPGTVGPGPGATYTQDFGEIT